MLHPNAAVPRMGILFGNLPITDSAVIVDPVWGSPGSFEIACVKPRAFVKEIRPAAESYLQRR